MTKQFKHKNLLRNDQVIEAKAELQRMEHMLGQPHLQDRAEMMRQKHGVEKMLNDAEPIPFTGEDIDQAVAREQELRDTITRDMPTAAEMRHAPPGIIGRHRQWERQNKTKIQEWKYIRRRMYSGSDDPDVSNIERYRPRSGGQEGNLDSGIVERKPDIFVPMDAVRAVTMSDEQETALTQVDPELAGRMALLDADQRAAILAIVDRQLGAKPQGGLTEQPANVVETLEIDDGRGLHMKEKTPEERKALGAKLAEARKAAKVKREAEQEITRMAEAVAT